MEGAFASSNIPTCPGGEKWQRQSLLNRVEMMIEAGVRNVYRIVGDSANPVVDAIRRSYGKLNFVNVRHEEAGAFAAGADSQVSRRPVAVIGSSGPGALHLLNGLYDCARNHASVFAIATHIPCAEIGTQYFKETRPDQIFLDCCKYISYVVSPLQMPRLAELAMQAAILNPPYDVEVGTHSPALESGFRLHLRLADDTEGALAGHISGRGLRFGCYHLMRSTASHLRSFTVIVKLISPRMTPGIPFL